MPQETRAQAQGVEKVTVIGPETESALRSLMGRRTSLIDQLRDLTERRATLEAQRQGMTGDAARSHNARIATIDARSAQLESQLFATDDALSALRGGDIGLRSKIISVGRPVDPGARDAAILSSAVEDAVFGAFATGTATLLGIWVLWRGFRRFIWKRTPGTALPGNAAQLTQLQQSMDVIALEVERISEAQRYTAKLLSERSGVETR